MPELSHDRLSNLAADLMEREFDRIPRMREFHLGLWTDHDYYVRDLIETILRIRLNNPVSAYALYKVGSADDALSAHLAKYLAEEYGHENMFLHDLKVFGVTLADVNATPAFPSTVKLMGYLKLTADTEGPVPTALWDWYAEWYAGRYYQLILDRAASDIGAEFVRGTQKHIDFDEGHDHVGLTFSVLGRAVQGWSTPEETERHLATCIELVGEYFRDVYETTIGASEGSRLALAGTGTRGI